MRKILSLILVCLLSMAIFSGCGENSTSTGADELNPASSVSLGENGAAELKDKTPVKLYFINEQGNKLAPETRYISNTEVSKGTDSFATAIVKELITGPAKGSLLQATIPQGTKVHSNVTIKDGIATVDLSKEFIDKHPGGKKKEQLTLYSIVNSLTELSDIKSVQFKIEGKVKKEFKGNYQIDIAYPRSAYLNSTSIQEKTQDVTKIDSDAAAKDSKAKDDSTKDNSSKDQSKDQKNGTTDKEQKTNADVDENGDLLE